MLNMISACHCRLLDVSFAVVKKKKHGSPLLQTQTLSFGEFTRPFICESAGMGMSQKMTCRWGLRDSRFVEHRTRFVEQCVVLTTYHCKEASDGSIT